MLLFYVLNKPKFCIAEKNTFFARAYTLKILFISTNSRKMYGVVILDDTLGTMYLNNKRQIKSLLRQQTRRMRRGQGYHVDVRTDQVLSPSQRRRLLRQLKYRR